MKKSVWVVGAVLALALLAPAPGVFGQVSDTDVLQQLRTDLRADRQAVVAAAMELTEAEGQAFWPVYREYQAEMAKVGDRMQKLIQEYAKVYESATPEQARGMVDEMIAIGKAELKVKETFVPKFRKVLPELKVARLLQVENKIDALVRFDLADAIPLIKPTKK
jgi:polyhydroxyalkanoate synthesis regulator phasin